MANFKEYTRLCREIRPPEALKVKVMESFRSSTSSYPYSAHNLGRRQLRPKLILVAVLVLAFLITACTIAVSGGLIEWLTGLGLADAETLDRLSTKADESFGSDLTEGENCLALAGDDWAEYKVLEAICDNSSIYIHFHIQPVDDGIMLIDQTLVPDSPASQLGISGITEGTVAEFADKCGKELRYASIYICYDGEPISDFGQAYEVSPDGSLHIYGSSQNPSEDKEFVLTCTAFTYPVEQQSIVPVEERTEFSVSLQNKSSRLSSMVFTSFDPEIEEKYQISIESLVIEETELGYYCTFTYRGKEVLFSMLDENGEYFTSGGPRGSSSNTLNSDGSYSITEGVPKVEHPERLMFMLVDGNFDKHGPYSFAP